MSERTKYFIEQKLIGLVMILIGVVSAIVLDGDVTVLSLFGTIGFIFVTTKSKILMNSYYYETYKRRWIKIWRRWLGVFSFFFIIRGD